MGLNSPKKVIFSRNAHDSIKEISEYLTLTASVEVARHVRNKIINRCRDLGAFSNYAADPYLQDLGIGFSAIYQWNYCIIFQVKDSEVRILDVVHTSRHPALRQTRLR